MKICIGSRKSALAKIQAYTVANYLKEYATSQGKKLEIDFLFKSSFGDQNLDVPLKNLPEKGVFTKDLQEDLAAGRCDLVVHSWKDLPIEMPSGHELVGTLKREDPRDLLIIKKEALSKFINGSLKELKILSSSPRREFNLSRYLYQILPFEVSSLHFKNIRGNIPTRVAKLNADSEAHALVLAKAAVDRLLGFNENVAAKVGAVADEELFDFINSLRTELSSCEWLILPLRENPSAPAQGALAIELMEQNSVLKGFLKVALAQYEEAKLAVNEERKVLAAYGGGCHQKIGAHCYNFTGDKRQKAYLFLKGQKESGEDIDFEGPLSLWKATQSATSIPPQKEVLKREQIWPLEDSKSQFFEREILPLTAQDKKIIEEADHILVTRIQALNEGIQLNNRSRLWVSGQKSWEQMAKLKYWVSGSLESLGFRPEEENHSFYGVGSWVRLTHDRAPQQKGATTVATYRLRSKFKNSEEAREMLPDKNTNLCYWMSSSAFVEAYRLAPKLLEAIPRHSCGVGITFKELEPILKKMGRTIETYISLEDCINQNTNRGH